MEKSDKNLEIYKKINKEIYSRIRECLSKLEVNIRDLMEMKSLIKKNCLIEDWIEIENYDIAKLTNNEKSDFKNIFKNIDNYINQKFNYYEYTNKVEELNLSDYLLKRERGRERQRGSENTSYERFLYDQLLYLENELRNNYLNIYKKDDLKISYENISNDDELLDEINLYKKSYKKSYKNISDEFNEIGNFTLNDDYRTTSKNDNKNNYNNDNKNNDDKNNDDKNDDNKNNDNKNNDNKNNDDNNDDKNNDDKNDKCKFENCDREATYRKLKIGNCHLKDTKYEYCSYHRPKNSINKKFPYKSIFNKVNIPLHYFSHTNEIILNDYHDYIYKTLKNNKFKFPIKITIYTENLLYDPFNSNILNEINVEHIQNYEKYFKNSIINTNDVYDKIIEFNDYYINRKIDMLNTHYNRNDYNMDNINEFNALDYNIKQKLSDQINFNNKYSRKIYLELCDLISYQIDNVSKTYTILNENDINIQFNQIKKIWKKISKNYPGHQKINFYVIKNRVKYL